MRAILLAGIFGLFLSSCYTEHEGNVSSGPLLSVKDKYVGVARGQAKAKQSIFSKDYKKETLILESKMDMFRNRPLKENEYYANFSMELSKKHVPFFGLRWIKVVVSADILSQSDTTTFKTFVSQYGNSFIGKTIKTSFVIAKDTFKVGDVVYTNVGNEDGEYNQMEVMYVTDLRTSLKYTQKNESNEVVFYDAHEFYDINRSNHGFKPGDQVELISIYDKNKVAKAKILGINSRNLLVATDFGIYSVPPARLRK
jgi:hypothetical protein